MINPAIVECVDRTLDEQVADEYKNQPLAQDWARVAKDKEEHGEAIAELILATGQNPRKGRDPAAMERLVAELADRAMTSVYAIQHFTKDVRVTEHILRVAQEKHHDRLCPS
jgi:hypothetical protein